MSADLDLNLLLKMGVSEIIVEDELIELLRSGKKLRLAVTLADYCSRALSALIMLKYQVARIFIRTEMSLK